MGLESAVSEIVNFIKSLSSPVQIIGLLVIVIFIRKLVQSRFRKPPPPPREKPLEPMKKRDFTPQELLEYDGVKQKRVLLAVNFKVFDVTRGKDFYGPGKLMIQFFHRFVGRKVSVVNDVGFLSMSPSNSNSRRQIVLMVRWSARFVFHRFHWKWL